MIDILLNSYDRKARLYPALLVMLVPVISFTLVAPVFSRQIMGLASLAITLGTLMFLSSLGRERGKRIEPQLFQAWNGTPTTLMVLHATTDLDHVTLARYRKVLEANIKNLKFLDPVDEESDRPRAVSICESAVKWLRETTRDSKKFPLIFAENTNYGFRRNLLGVKPVAILMCLLTFLITALYAWLATAGNVLAISSQSWTAAVVALIGLIIWGRVVNAEFVKTTAFTYATALLAACDSPYIAKEKPKATKIPKTSVPIKN